MYGGKGIWAPNGTLIETPKTIYDRTASLSSRALQVGSDIMREYGAQTSNYATALTSSSIGGARPSGLGYSFPDTWDRTQKGIMEFSLPVGQTAVIDMAQRFCSENVFVAKAMMLKTLFTTKGIQNQTADDKANEFLDSVNAQLHLARIFREAVSMYYSVGLVPILLPEAKKPLDWVELYNPKFVRVTRSYGKTKLYLIPTQRMLSAMNDPNGDSDVTNRDYYNSMPDSWKKQLQTENQSKMPRIGGERCLDLEDGSYIVIENRYSAFDRNPGQFDSCPLYPYFSACENYRMMMAADFATSFLMKNIIALVSIGDPKAPNYMEPGDTENSMLMSIFQNPNKAEWVYGSPTLNVRYITPDPNVLDNKKYAEVKDILKNLLPGPFWYSEKGGSFADATVELQWLEEEAVSCQNAFDEYFWKPIYERATEGRSRIAKKNIKPPTYDRSALRDRAADLQAKSTLFNNGGLDIKSLIREHGLDPDVIEARKREQMKDVKSGLWAAQTEQKQGITAAKLYGLGSQSQASSDGGKGGRPKKPGSRPQSESSTGRTPRPSERTK